MKRTIEITEQPQDKRILEKIKDEGLYNNIFEDLIAFTGLTKEQVEERLLRDTFFHYQDEFNWHEPKSFEELTWYYRTSYGYLFGNAVHPYWKLVEMLTGQVEIYGKVLDYGAGVGHNVIAIAKKGIHVDYFDIGFVQESFVRLRAKRHGLKNIGFIPPYENGKFDPIGCIKDKYAAIILEDILEHIPNYHITLKHLIDRLLPNGIILEKTWFDNEAADIALHLKPAIPLKEAMQGMKPTISHVWRKLQ